jgi:hypothetical protein
MSALADLTRAERQHLLERLADADDLDHLMRERAPLASAPEPPPLHRAERDTANFSTGKTKSFSTSPMERTSS